MPCKLPATSKTMQAIFDSHCHLDMVIKKGLSYEEVYANLQENNIDGFIQIAADYESVKYARESASLYPQGKVFYTIGMHPAEAKVDTRFKSLSVIDNCVDDKNFKAVGEIGLDYFYGKEEVKEQIELFNVYLDKALEVNFPVAIHTRDAHADTLQCLKKINGRVDVLIHCFTGDLAQVKDYLNAGYYISFSGIVTFNSADSLREAAKFCPPEKMLVETDAPYLAPVPFRGKTNQPARVRDTLNFIADLKKIPRDELAQITRENTYSFYRIDKATP